MPWRSPRRWRGDCPRRACRFRAGAGQKGRYTQHMARKRMVKAGERAPGFRIARLNGGEVTLQDITANGPALLAFFKISCPVCQLTFPYLDRIYATGRLPVYGVSQNDADSTREFNARYGVSFPALLDAEDAGFPVSNEYGITTVPTLLLVEADGTIASVQEGFSKRDLESLGGKAGVNPFRAGERVPDWKAG